MFNVFHFPCEKQHVCNSMGRKGQVYDFHHENNKY